MILAGYLKAIPENPRGWKAVFASQHPACHPPRHRADPRGPDKEGLFLEHSVRTNILYPKVSMHRGSFFLPEPAPGDCPGAIKPVSLVPPTPGSSCPSSPGATSRRWSWENGLR